MQFEQITDAIRYTFCFEPRAIQMDTGMLSNSLRNVGT